jgi:hypothetical protein
MKCTEVISPPLPPLKESVPTTWKDVCDITQRVCGEMKRILEKEKAFRGL